MKKNTLHLQQKKTKAMIARLSQYFFGFYFYQFTERV